MEGYEIAGNNQEMMYSTFTSTPRMSIETWI